MNTCLTELETTILIDCKDDMLDEDVLIEPASALDNCSFESTATDATVLINVEDLMEDRVLFESASAKDGVDATDHAGHLADNPASRDDSPHRQDIQSLQSHFPEHFRGFQQRTLTKLTRIVERLQHLTVPLSAWKKILDALSYEQRDHIRYVIELPTGMLRHPSASIREQRPSSRPIEFSVSN